MADTLGLEPSAERRGGSSPSKSTMSSLKWNKRYRNPYMSARREVIRQYIRDYLSEHPCVDCGEHDFVVLDFDHVRGEKVKAISKMVSSAGYSLETIQKEIDKCDVRCANCHRRRTHATLAFNGSASAS